MTKLSLLQKEMCRILESGGVKVLEAFPAESAKRYAAPLVVVAVKELKAEEAGFHNYLGESYDEAAKTWQERYGQKTAVTFSLSIYSPRSCGEAGCRETMEAVSEILQKDTPAKLPLKQMNWGKISYDKSCDMLLLTGEILCEGMLYSVSQEGSDLLVFEVKGGMTLESNDKS